MDFGYFDKSTKSRQVKNMEKTFEDEIIGAIKKFTAGYTSVRAAAESLGVTYETFRSWHDGIKSPSIKSLSLTEDAFATYISCDTTVYRRRMNNTAVKKTLTIPSWLNDSAVAAGLNFSQVLQEALRQKLNIL